MNTIVRQVFVNEDFTAEFKLYPIYHPGGQDYDVSVTDMHGHSWLFRMKQNPYGHWKISNAPKVPDWIISLEPRLQEIAEQASRH